MILTMCEYFINFKIRNAKSLQQIYNIYLYLYLYKKIYYKELTHGVMEAEGIPRSEVGKLDTQESQWCKFQFESKSKGRRRLISLLKTVRQRGSKFSLTQPFALFRPSPDLTRSTKYLGSLWPSEVDT